MSSWLATERFSDLTLTTALLTGFVSVLCSAADINGSDYGPGLDTTSNDLSLST